MWPTKIQKFRPKILKNPVKIDTFVGQSYWAKKDKHFLLAKRLLKMTIFKTLPKNRGFFWPSNGPKRAQARAQARAQIEIGI